MDFVKELEKLEDHFFGEWEEDKTQLIAALREIHRQIDDDDEFNRFMVQTSDRFGGAYIPYLFWDKLGYFLRDPEQRYFLQQLIKAFVNSNFDEAEQRAMKPLIVTYLAREKKFEVDKLWAQIISKAHPEVQEYFENLNNFVGKNQKATEMYCEKFDLLKNIHPDFHLLSLPITQVREKLQEA